MLNELDKRNIRAKCFSFPDRSTIIGNIINNYLLKKVELPDQAVHLLFSANRWELESKMKNMLLSGVTLLVDRYFYSGIAFTAAKPGMDFEWCKEVEHGLPKPDLVLFLDVNAAIASSRDDYGKERYENTEFQQKVAENFKLLQDSTWKIVEGSKGITEVTDELLSCALKVIDDVTDSLKIYGY